jgi:hypothetical protein
LIGSLKHVPSDIGEIRLIEPVKASKKEYVPTLQTIVTIGPLPKRKGAGSHISGPSINLGVCRIVAPKSLSRRRETHPVGLSQTTGATFACFTRYLSTKGNLPVDQFE